MEDHPIRAPLRARGLLEDLVSDLRFAVRGLARNPTFATVAALTIAVGIGATSAMLAIGYAVLLRPPPIAEPDRMVSIWELRTGSVTESIEGRLLPYARYQAYREATDDVFEDLAGHAYRDFAVGTDEGAVALDGFATSENYFAVLGLAPRLGRFYENDEGASVVLSERLWRSRFGADATLVGRTISVDGQPFTVIGVAAPGFAGTMSGFTGDVWVPAGALARLGGGTDGPGPVVPIGRLRAGVDRRQAAERIDAVARAIPPLRATTVVRGARLDGLLWRGDLRGTLDRAVAVMVTAAALLLLIAAVNVAGMMLARGYDRRREVAVRLAIGAGPGRLVRQLLAESVLLALVGGAAGVLLALVATAALSRMSIPVGATVTLDVVPDAGVLLASFGVAAVTGLLFGIGPALRSASTDLTTSLKEGAQGPGGGRRRAAFVVGQLALSTLLLLVAGLFVRSFASVAAVPLGFEAEGVLVAGLSVGRHGYGEEEGRAFYDRVLERVRALPEVEAAGLGRFVLLGGSNASNDGVPLDDGGDAQPVGIGYNVVDPGYFVTNRMELLEGRFFTEADARGSPPVAVVNRTLAERFWPGRSALGRRFRSGGVEREVVGVVRDGVYVFQYEMPAAFSFYPLAQGYRPEVALHVRSAGALGPVAASIRGIVRELDPDIAVEGLRTMEEVVSANRFGHRFIAWLTAVFAAAGLLLSAVGVYGLLAVQVSQRAREFGVRRALGAKVPDVVLLVVRRGAVAAALGCALGILSALGVGRVLESLLYGVRPFDAVTFAVVPAVLLAAAVLASAVPARRATRVSPTTALREE